jgi:hypothetical protein
MRGEGSTSILGHRSQLPLGSQLHSQARVADKLAGRASLVRELTLTRSAITIFDREATKQALTGWLVSF